MADYEIEKGVSLPGPEKYRRAKYPFDHMECGDSFRLNGESPASVRNAAGQAARRKGGKFSVRKTDDGYRCWRTA